jgi:hypothetical protein
MKTKILYLLILGVLFISNCTIGPKYSQIPPPPEGKSLVVLFCSYGAANFHVDGKEVVSLFSKGYSYIYLNPGSHIIETSSLKLKSEVILPNKTYYYERTTEQWREYVATGYIMHTRIILRQVPPDIGLNLIYLYSYKEAKQ